MPGIKDLKTRIKSVQSTRKITRAMQMVSAAKMRKSQNSVLQSRSYAHLAWELIENISRKGSFNHPLISIYPNAKKIGVILLTSNRGMVGSLNANLLFKLREIEKEAEFEEKEVELITYGKKGSQTSARLGKNIKADFSKPEKYILPEEIYPLAYMISEMYSSGQYKKIYLAFNHFVSTLLQKPTIRPLLPFSQEIRTMLTESNDQPLATDSDYLFEPGIGEVLNHMLPRIIESQIYETVLESDASEHSARMVMMKNATEAAGDLISDYTLTYNQLRQGKITTELAEITAGKIALE